MNVLLLVDLEGVVGVDHVDDLVVGQPAHDGARAMLGAELTAACDGLRRGVCGAETIVVSDSHHGGAGPNVDVAALPAGVRLHRSPDDDYPPALLEEVEAVACLGMHAGVAGFVPHTLDLCCVWECDGRPVSEADLLLGVAAGRGLPAVFLAGDDALDPRGLPFVPTKTALSPVAARSRPLLEVLEDLRRVAMGPPRPAPALAGPLAIRFRSRWMAEAAERLGQRRLDETAVALALPGDDLEAAIRRGREVVARASAPWAAALRPWAVAEDAAALASRPLTRALPPDRTAEARRALAALLARTEDPTHADDWSRALRALTLHMLEAHAPAFFVAEELAPVLDKAVAALSDVPAVFPPELAPEEAMARLDALYVRHERGGAISLDHPALARYLEACRPRAPLHAWLLGELAGQLGAPAGQLGVPAGQLEVPVTASLPSRPFRRDDRLRDLVWLTHLVLLETRYLRRPLAVIHDGWQATTIEELLLAAPALVAGGQLDIAAEVAFCLAAAGEHRAPERAAILAALAAHQQPDGTLVEPRPPDRDPRQRFRNDTHATASALLALATAGPVDPGPPVAVTSWVSGAGPG